MGDQIKITLLLGGRSYSLKVNAGDREQVALAAELLQKKFLEMKLQFPTSDAQDLLAMSSIMHLSEQLKKNLRDHTLSESIESKLDAANAELLKVMKVDHQKYFQRIQIFIREISDCIKPFSIKAVRTPFHKTLTSLLNDFANYRCRIINAVSHN